MKRRWLTRLLIVGTVVLIQTSAATGYADRSWSVVSDGPSASTLAASTLAGANERPAEHLRLARPFSVGARQWIETTFPYGSDGGGRYRLHTGVDFGNPLGTPVLAVAAGQVVYAGDDAIRRFGPTLDFYGRLVIVKLAQGYCQSGAPAAGNEGCQILPVFVLYAHLNRISVKAGQSIQEGDLIGTAGMTGIAIGPHLHLEVRLSQEDVGATRNPALWLRPLDGHGLLAGRLLDAEGGDVRDDRLLVYRVDGGTQLWRVVRTYPAETLINPDDAWHENFALADVPAGKYLLVAGLGARTVRTAVTVTAGHMAFVELSLPR